MSYLNILNEELNNLKDSFDIVKLYEGKSPQEKAKNKEEFIKELSTMYDFLFIIVNDKIKKIKPKEISDNGLRKLYISIKGHPKDNKKREDFEKRYKLKGKGKSINYAHRKYGFEDIEIKGKNYILYTSNAYYNSMNIENFNIKQVKLGKHKSVKLPKTKYLYNSINNIELLTKSIKVDTGIEKYKYDPRNKSQLTMLVGSAMRDYLSRIARGEISGKFTVSIQIPIEYPILRSLNIVLEVETISPDEILKLRSNEDKEIEDRKNEPIYVPKSSEVYPDDGRMNRYWGD